MADDSDNDSQINIPPPEEEGWVRVQRTTFTNWVNEKLKTLDIEIEDIRTDFSNGINLVKLVEILQGKSLGKYIKKPNNHYQCMGNIAQGLEGLQKDGMKLINIGAEDIKAGNLKLLLGLIWQLIRKYQIGGATTIPPKKLMLAWINAVLAPYRTINNFSSDWNDGIALCGILDYCSGDFPRWWERSRSDALQNCQEAMEYADSKHKIPMVVSPENFCSSDLDELSGMTYLSYFMIEDSCGFDATLKWTNSIINETVTNFTTDWNNGYALADLSTHLGGVVAGFPFQNADSRDWVETLQLGVDSSRTIGVEPVVSAKEMSKPTCNHIAIMAYAALHRTASGRTEPEPPPPPAPAPAPVFVPVPVITPPTPPQSDSESEPEPEPPAPPPPMGDPIVTIVEQWRVHVATTIQIDCSEVGDLNVTGDAIPPSGDGETLLVSRVDDRMHHASFTPTEKGQWKIELCYDGEPMADSPFDMNVYDPSLARIIRTQFGETPVFTIYSFEVDVSETNIDDVQVYVILGTDTVPNEMQKVRDGRYEVSFTPHDTGVHKIAVYCGGLEVPDSPFDVIVGAGDIQDVHGRGNGLTHALIGKEAIFQVDATSSPGRSLDVTIIPPRLKPLQKNQTSNGEGLFTITYVPQEQGVHLVEIIYDGQPIEGSPFKVNVRYPEVNVRGIDPFAWTWKMADFDVDASEVGKGSLEIEINDGELPVRNVRKVTDRRYNISFMPERPGNHKIKVKHNNRTIRGCPIKIEVRDIHDATEEDLRDIGNGY